MAAIDEASAALSTVKSLGGRQPGQSPSGKQSGLTFLPQREDTSSRSVEWADPTRSRSMVAASSVGRNSMKPQRIAFGTFRSCLKVRRRRQGKRRCGGETRWSRLFNRFLDRLVRLMRHCSCPLERR